jgi:hypothetical protein
MRRIMMPKQPATNAMLDQIAGAIADADGAEVRADPDRYRRLALAALKPLVKPTGAMIDAAHEAVWPDGFWAIDRRRDFPKAVRAAIMAALDGDEGARSSH